MAERDIKIVVDEEVNKMGRSMLKAYVYEGTQERGFLAFPRWASPRAIAEDIKQVGELYKKSKDLPPFGDIFIAASKKVPGLK